MPILQRVSQRDIFQQAVFKIIAELKVLHTQVSTVNQPKSHCLRSCYSDSKLYLPSDAGIVRHGYPESKKSV